MKTFASSQVASCSAGALQRAGLPRTGCIASVKSRIRHVGAPNRPSFGLQQLDIAHRRSSLLPPKVWPFDVAWGTALDAETLNQTLPQNLFAFSIVPYAGFLYHLTRSKKVPPMTVFGFYFLLVFVFATIPAGIYAKKVYGTSLANVDYLHGTAEFLLTMTNLFIVLGLRKAIREEEIKQAAAGKSGEDAAEGAAASQPDLTR